MQHLQVKATATTQDQGVFSALAAAYSVDRVQERIIPGAFAKTIAAWQTSQKKIPLHWDHQASADSIIGWIDPASMMEMEEGLYVEGKLDIETSDVAKEAWRSMKNNAVSLSFGYLPKLRKGKDGVTEITEVDLFEISIVPAPANADTRVLSLKALEEAKPDNLSAEAWKLVLRDELKLAAETPKSEGPKALARFPDVQTEDDFKALTFHDKLAVYYAGLDDEDTESAKAVWANTFVAQLPDTSFLYCGRVTEANAKGTTTEDRRCFPVKDEKGNLDVPHLRDALSRIPLSSLTQKVKDKLTSETSQALKQLPKASAVEDGQHDEPEKAKSAPQDPLVREAWDLVLPKASRRPPESPQPEPEPLDPAEVQREAWALALKTSGT